MESLCASPVSPDSSVRCSEPAIQGSYHCLKHQGPARRSYQKYKKKERRVEKFQKLLQETTDPTLLLKLYGALEAEYSLRLSHREQFFVPQLYDRGHDQALERRYLLIRECEEKLEALFTQTSLERPVETEVNEEESQEQERPEDEQRPRDYTAYRKHKRRIEKTRKKWEELDRILEKERLERQKTIQEIFHLESVIFGMVYYPLVNRGRDPTSSVQLKWIWHSANGKWDEYLKWFGYGGTVQDGPRSNLRLGSHLREATFMGVIADFVVGISLKIYTVLLTPLPNACYGRIEHILFPSFTSYTKGIASSPNSDVSGVVRFLQDFKEYFHKNLGYYLGLSLDIIDICVKPHLITVLTSKGKTPSTNSAQVLCVPAEEALTFIAYRGKRALRTRECIIQRKKYEEDDSYTQKFVRGTIG